MTLKEWTEVFGDNLSELMEEKHITQRQLANMSGLSLGSINAYIHHQSQPGIKAIINLSYALDVDLNELLDFGDTID
jgi:transcriptional regulator with XRE-family HTH domain